MAHAWLDSLSEDWVSQPGSDNSEAQLPSPRPIETKSLTRSPEHSSRIPRRTNGARSSVPPVGDSSIAILSERSANHNNISSQRIASKLSQDIKASQADAGMRCSSAESNGSVVHNSVRHRSSEKFEGQTPEWKRRLLGGGMNYGEQRDLFCSAAAGLQDMFKPPEEGAADEFGDDVVHQPEEEQHESTMPSSPPGYQRRRTSVELEAELNALDLNEEEFERPNDVTPSPSPRRTERDIKYRLNVEDTSLTCTPSNAPVHRNTSHLAPHEVEIYRDESCLSTQTAEGNMTRKTSGQSDTRNEDFSPILIGKHSDQEGKVEFSPLELPADQLKQKLERLRINQMLWDAGADVQDAFDSEARVEQVDNTDDYGRQGGYINFQRGGRSAEGSFRHRALSPGFEVDTSEMLPEESLQASTPKQYPTVRTETHGTYRYHNDLPSPSLPRAPFPSPEKRGTISNAVNGVTSTSPLKLFGPYDTFTNQTLLRRISQFESNTSGSTSRHSGASHTRDNPPGKDGTSSSPSVGSRSVSEFGAGDLEGYQFHGDLSYTADNESMSSETDKENQSPQPQLNMRYSAIHGASLGPSSGKPSELVVRRRRDKSLSASVDHHRRVSSMSSQLRKTLGIAQGAPDLGGATKRDSGSEGKRPRTSPSKDPTPKRRRTLHESDIAFGRENLAGIELASQQFQSAIRKQRLDRETSGFDLAEPRVLASRSLLRPRTPSEKLQRLRKQSEEGQDARHAGASRSPRNKHHQGSQFDEIQIDGERKPSIRTQDFVDQAAQIMAMIRSQVRPPGLASVEESGTELEKGSPGPSEEFGSDSTKEPFSRPPSREGKPSIPRAPYRQDDPALMERLKKFQEASDMGDVVSSSLRSLAFAQDAIRAAEDADVYGWDKARSIAGRPMAADEGDMISDIPNIRITTNPISEDVQRSPSRDYLSNGSGHSTGRSFPTGSSRGSDSRKVIMPESVSHLIPERVGSMRLDKDHNMWIKSKEVKAEQPVAVPQSDSEDDPFASIPDLSVDLTKEMQNLRLTTARKENGEFVPEEREDPMSPTSFIKSQSRRPYTTISPNGKMSSSAASHTAETPKPHGHQSDDNEFEIRDFAHNRPIEKAKRRNITISFSSPVASFIQDGQVDALDDVDDHEEDATGEAENAGASPVRSSGPAGPTKSALKNGGGNGPGRNQGRPSSRHLNSGDQEFVPRPVSRIDEQDEDSTVELPHHDNHQLSIIGDTSIVSHKTPEARCTSLSFILNGTPGHGQLSLRGEDSALIGQNVGKLSLSPLSEFTLNNSNESFGFEVSYVMGRRHMETGTGTKKVMSMTIRDLVDRLSEVEPFEPYWEDLTELDVQGKRLTSLHMLDEFCGKVVKLDASSNALGHLEGVPLSVRQLKVSQNMLTELTSWDHLTNLQYVDVSGNELQSLSALKHLVHLRSVKADDNQLTSLDGLDNHDGLLHLRARNNLIEEVDFASLQLERLTELDLAGNQINCIRNLEVLPALSKLKVSHNKLEEFVIEGTVRALRHLDVSDNDLTSLDIGNLPGLHSLYADRNSLTELRGFSRARRLDSLSLREQRGSERLDVGFLAAAYEVRKLFLSGNYLGTFEPRVDFLNLQFLELANCGLQSLPEDLGQLMPNLRTLNLNFNAISDVSALRFVPRLKKLLLAGNRLADSTTVTELLIDYPHLTQLDMRDNPITLGFYAPLQVLVPTQSDQGAAVDPFVLPNADEEKDETYAKRLDDATRQRRRLHQIVFVTSCERLRMLDGLRIRRRDVLARDAIWQALVSEDLLPQLDGEGTATGVAESAKAAGLGGAGEIDGAAETDGGVQTA